MNKRQLPGIKTIMRKIEGQPLEAVNSFVYIGSVLERDSSIEDDILSKIGKASGTCISVGLKT